MDLTHSFTVPASKEATWAAFNDIESVAGCFPGATVDAVEGDAFEGSCKVKLGPIALVYKGSGAFVEKDEEAGMMRIEAKGKDKRGNGTAGANVTAQLTEEGEGTRVEVVTDLAITGKPAQFGRGVIQDVSDKLLGQFVQCLERKLSGAAEPEPAAEEAPMAAAAEPAAVPSAASASDAGSHRAEVPPVSSVRSAPAAPAAEDDALDLGAALLPVLIKSYWKQGLGALVALIVVGKLLRKLR